ncbi:MAG: thiamine phosphate synthase [Chitinophagales bacterium]|nr:thiamine phosphate synthase [Chitinophagales bacterium]
MKIIVISNPEEIEGEMNIVHELFKAGLQRFHLRKPKYSTGALRRVIQNINPEYYNRIIIHSHHELSIAYKLAGVHITGHHRRKKYLKHWLLLKYIKLRRPEIDITCGFHTIGALNRKSTDFSYVFLSPVFDSISKIGYKSTFNEDSLKFALKRTSYKVVALGGVDEANIEKARQLGFYGVALLGSIWKAKDPVEKFKRIQQLCLQDVVI